jgi:hypothetical protein
MTMRLFLLAALAVLFAPFGEASIKIVDSEKEYSSKMDKLYGTQLKKGLQYPAHLQQIPGNAHLCQDVSNKWKNWNVTVPKDGLPGAYNTINLKENNRNYSDVQKSISHEPRPCSILTSYYVL